MIGSYYLLLCCLSYLWSWDGILNHFHDVDPAESAVSRQEQIQDSTSIVDGGFSIVTDSSSFHALHHWFPNIPYHALADAHEELLRILPEEHYYRKTLSSSAVDVFRGILKGNS